MEKKRSFLGFLASLFIVFFTANAFAAGYTCNDLKKYTSCNAGYYLNGTGVGNSCTKCPDAYPNSDTGNSSGITACYSNTKSRAWTGAQNNGTTPTNCASVTAWNACSMPACDYVAYANSAGTGDGTIKSGCSTNNASCTKTPKTVTAATNSYVDGTSCKTCSSFNSGYPKSDGGNISNAYCYAEKTKTGEQVNGKTPTNCASVTAWNTCTPGTCTYKDYYSATDTTCTPKNCEKTPKSVTASPNYYVNNATCSACSGVASGAYPKSDGGNISSAYCYVTKTKTGTQKNGTTPPNCASVTAWNTCTPGTCTYKDYYTATDTTCTPLDCTKTPKTVTAAPNSYVDGTSCKTCSSYNSTYPKSDGGSIGYAYCYREQTKTGQQVNDSTPSGCYSVTSWNSCTPGTCTYKDYLSATDTTCTADNCTKTAKTVTAGSGNYVNGATCPVCDASYPISPQGNSYAANQCYRNCTPTDVANSKTVSGTVTKGGTNTCKATACKDGYYYKDGVCNVCPANAECDPNPGSNPITCDDGYTLNAAGTGCTANKYNVTYSCAPGTGTVAGNTATYNVSYSPKPNSCTAPSKHQFVGWTISGTSTVVIPGASFTWKYLENKTFTAKYEPTSCDSGEFLSNGTCVSCPSGYTASDLNATSNTQCYKTCENSCVSPTCPENSTKCTFDTTAKWTGKQYYNSSTCQINDGQKSDCPIATLECKRNYYTNGSVCSACSGLGDGSYNMSLSTNNSSPNGCYAVCKIPCTQQECPAHATCTHGEEVSAGGKYYPSEDCTAPGISCSIIPTPDEGYECNGGTCNPIVTSVVLNRNYDASDNTAVATIYQKYETGWYSNSAATTTLSKATVPTRTNYNFLGYYTARTGGTRIIAADGTLPANTTYKTSATVTLYAQWESSATPCQAGKYYDGTNHVECPAGKYCPGTGTSPYGTAGCAVSCPADASNGTVSSPKGSSAITACGTTRANQTLSDGTGRYTQHCLYDATKRTYSVSCEVVNVTACNAGYYLANSTDKTCTGVPRGEYSGTDALEKYSCQSLSGANANTTTAADKAGTPTLCYNTCQATAIENGQMIPTNAQEFFNGTTIPACTYTPQCNANYAPNATKTQCIWADPDKCPAGYYCDPDPIECPDGGTSDTGATSIEQCYKVYDPYSEFQNGTGSAVCYYLKTAQTANKYSKCQNIQAKTCNAGYYYRDIGTTTCIPVVSGNYSPEGPLGQTACPAGGNGSNEFAANWDACYKNCEITVAHSSTVAAKDNTVFGISANAYAACSFHVTCQTGYSPNNNDTAAPTCDANRYTVTLDKNGGEGNVAASIECTFDSGACALPTTTGLTRAGYSVGTKWCTAKDGTGTCYNGGTTVTTNISSNGTATTLYAIWTPNVYQITLKHADATVAGAPATAYLKYATGWFADNSATLPLSQMSKTPEKTGYEFAGYKAANNTVIVDANGMFQTTQAALTFTTAAADVTVVWTADSTKCAAGTYYQGTGAICLPCTDNHYCPGGSFATDGGQAGLNECRDNGKTAADAHASSETQCFKEDLPTYVAAHGKGTQKCYFDTENLTYSAECTDKFITSCDAGYWQENKSPVQTAPDCAAVGNGYYSAENLTERTSCPNGGTTAETTAATVQRCYKSGMDYAAEFGTGTQRCYYSSGDGAAAIYNRDCDTKTINKCRGGYWLNTEITAEDCSPVGYDHYSETDDTARHACEGGGKTNSEITSSPLACYKDSEEYTATHGGGFRTCYYTSGTGASALYETSCETPTLTYCNGGYYADVTINTDDCIEAGYGFWSPAPTPSHLAESLERTSCAEGETTATATSESADACYTCPAGQICSPDNPNKPQTCSDATKGTHPNSDAGNTDVNGCWRECALAANAATMKGHDYYGKPDTCEIDRCKSGYTYNAATQACEICPEGTFCGGGEGGDDDCPAGQNCGAPKSCADLGDGGWKYSDVGATGPKSCYRKCESYALDGGTAIPVNERAYYANQCEYKGVDEEGNPCDIDDGACVTTSCKPSYEMIGGKCVACNRDHALSYKTTGNCMVESCEAGWHPYGQSCETDITECPAPNALRAEQQWDYKKNSYGICLIKECEDGFHISSNACVADVQECVVEHGIGEKEWNHTTNTWSECVATSCDPGFTNDPYETNEPTKQCGHCKNKFGVKGELAASSYSRGCTISACMYQGEMYNLENNECNPICDVNGYEDETGTMKWNPVTHKCERKCKEGYVMW
ncbi:MAG: InlB B-repeat-containing protein [Alphaproteobacteria bacterium]|nr:InlB B-repeat-containing protein [Alphaproteobacteria bacterium]